MEKTTDRYTAEQFVLMAASVDYTKGPKLNALHQMLTQAASDTARIAELTAEVAKYRAALDRIAEFGYADGLNCKVIARNALREGV